VSRNNKDGFSAASRKQNTSEELTSEQPTFSCLTHQLFFINFSSYFHIIKQQTTDNRQQTTNNKQQASKQASNALID
jgi:hypothetical protein